MAMTVMQTRRVDTLTVDRCRQSVNRFPSTLPGILSPNCPLNAAVPAGPQFTDPLTVSW